MTTLTLGDTSPALSGVVSANLTGATAVAHIKRPDKTLISREVTITAATTGAWELEWVEEDLNQRGWYHIEIQVTFSNDKIQTFATDSIGEQVSFYVRDEIA